MTRIFLKVDSEQERTPFFLFRFCLGRCCLILLFNSPDDTPFDQQSIMKDITFISPTLRSVNQELLQIQHPK